MDVREGREQDCRMQEVERLRRQSRGRGSFVFISQFKLIRDSLGISIICKRKNYEAYTKKVSKRLQGFKIAYDAVFVQVNGLLKEKN